MVMVRHMNVVAYTMLYASLLNITFFSIICTVEGCGTAE